VKLSLNEQRLKLVWLLILPFFYFARPTTTLLIWGGASTLIGALIRGWSAGHIRKDSQLCTSGPYAFTRNPLYLGSFLLGLGVVVAGGQWLFLLAFVIFFGWAYGRTMRAETIQLEGLFGDVFRDYRRAVPALIPRVTPYRRPDSVTETGPTPGFSFRMYWLNSEYEAALGILTGFSFLVIKMVWFT
jgi:hypothetical protein